MTHLQLTALAGKVVHPDTVPKWDMNSNWIFWFLKHMITLVYKRKLYVCQ